MHPVLSQLYADCLETGIRSDPAPQLVASAEMFSSLSLRG